MSVDILYLHVFVIESERMVGQKVFVYAFVGMIETAEIVFATWQALAMSAEGDQDVRVHVIITT